MYYLRLIEMLMGTETDAMNKLTMSLADKYLVNFKVVRLMKQVWYFKLF